MRRIVIIGLMCAVFFSCKKENDSPQWDINVIGPLLHATLGIGNLIGDSSIVTNADGSLQISYDSTFSNFNLDSIYSIPDTSYKTIVVFPPFPSTVQPGTSFPSNNNNLRLGLGNIQLKRAIINSGKIRIEIRNTVNSKLNFTYTIPKAKKDNVPFTISASVDSGSSSDPKFFSAEYDFSGYDVDMTGVNGNVYNTIIYNVNTQADVNGVPFNVGASDTMVNLTTTLVEIKPLLAIGYLGQENISEINDENIGIGGLVKNGLLKLDSVNMSLDIINYIGADAQAAINYMQSKNNRTGTTVDMIAPTLLNHSININRGALTNNIDDPVAPSHYHIQLDNSSSNITSFIENLPDKISFDLNMKLNPLGNASGSNDFVYSDQLIFTRLRINMPLRFAMDQLVLADTVPFTIAEATNFDPVGFTNLTLVADNGFPFDLNAQLFLLDSTNVVTDSMFLPDLILAAPVDASYKAYTKTRTLIKIPVDSERKQRLLSVTHIGVRFQFNTPDYPQLLQMYSDYKLDLKLIADGIYSIR